MQRHKGFTLLELMITMAIIAIIAAVAYPSYLKSAMKGRRADGKAAINQASQVLERCYATYGVYNNTNCTPENASSGPSLTSGITSQQGFYTIKGTVTGTTYSIYAQAVSTGPQAKDTGCTILALNNVGQQGSGSTTATTDANGCW
jgi:type IV pilus assembly protein PilE